MNKNTFHGSLASKQQRCAWSVTQPLRSQTPSSESWGEVQRSGKPKTLLSAYGHLQKLFHRELNPDQFYILLPRSQKRWSLRKFQLSFLFQWFTIGKMGVYIHLVQVTVSNSPCLKSKIWPFIKMEVQTAHGWGLAQDSEEPPGS